VHVICKTIFLENGKELPEFFQSEPILSYLAYEFRPPNFQFYLKQAMSPNTQYSH